MKKFLCLLFVVFFCATTASPMLSWSEKYPLHYAAGQGDAAEIERLLKEKICSVDDRNYSEETSLYVAAKKGYCKCIEILLQNGANVNATASPCDHTPLHCAVSYKSQGHLECTKILLAWQADVNAQSIDGIIPLHYAVADGSADSVHALLKRGADMSVQNTYGFTPLHYAAEKGRKDIVDILLSAGAEVDVKTKYGKTPAMIAKWEGHKELAEYLEQRPPEIKEPDVENENEKS